MTERPVGLDLNAPGTPSPGAGDARPEREPRGEADRELAERFREQLAGPAPGGQAPAEQAATRPFDLFAAARIPEAPARADAERRFELLGETVSRMLVSDASASGGAEVRIRLKDDLLPGTELRLFQREGRLEVEFAATDAESAAWLASQSESIAGELSRRLKREVRVAVRHGEPGSGEALADASAQEGGALPSGPASLFSTGLRDAEDGRGEEGTS